MTFLQNKITRLKMGFIGYGMIYLYGYQYMKERTHAMKGDEWPESSWLFSASTRELPHISWLDFPQLWTDGWFEGFSDFLLFPFPPTCLLNWNQCSSSFILSADCLNQHRVYQAPPDWHFPLAVAPTGDSITDSDPLGTDNPRLKPPDSVINDMSSGCDPCSLAVMPHVKPRELWRANKGDLYNYAAAQQSSPPAANIDGAWQDLY